MRLQWDNGALDWAASRIHEMHGRPFPENSRGVAFIRDDGDVAGVVAFHDWSPDSRTIQVSAAAADSRWMWARACWAQAFDYAFKTCGVDKIWTLTPADNVRALRFIKAVGFTPEAVLSHQLGRNRHAIFSYRLSWEHYRGSETASASAA